MTRTLVTPQSLAFEERYLNITRKNESLSSKVSPNTVKLLVAESRLRMLIDGAARHPAQVETASNTLMINNISPAFGKGRTRPYEHWRFFNSFWQGWPMLWQILAVSAVIQCVAAAIGAAIIIYEVKKEAASEMTKTLATAEQVVRREIDRISGLAGPAHSIEDLLFDFAMIRDVDVEVYTAAGKLTKRQHLADESDNPDVPQWFADFVVPKAPRRQLPVEVRGSQLGSVVLIAQMPDDIEDVWDAFVEFALMTLGINLLIFFLLFLALLRIVGPLRLLVEGLHNLEQGHYNVRLPRPPVLELAAITDRVNALADRLRNAHTENLSLSRRLISIQDDERRQIAVELHDELGPYLFGLAAELSSLRRLVGPAADGKDVSRRIERLLDIVGRIRDLNRQLLGKLRPIPVDGVSLPDALAGLMAELETFKGEAEIALTTTKLKSSYGEIVDLTVYRCVREGVVNAIRHADAQSIKISVFEVLNSENNGKTPSLRIIIEDDGRGISPNATRGYGLTGMRERVRALGGEISIAPGDFGGTKLEIRIALDEHLPNRFSPRNEKTT
jgi:two-component system, NarL family, sensor histidine kinase UhpB